MDREWLSLMRISLYCRDLKASGGRSVGIGLIGALARQPQVHEITAFVPHDPGYEALGGGSVRLEVADPRQATRHVLEHRTLGPRLVETRQDVVFMMGNLGFARPPCPQAVYIHNPWFLYPESSAWRRCSVRDWVHRRVRNRFIVRGLRRSRAVVSQTPVMLERLHRLRGIPYERLALIPNSVTSAAEGVAAEGEAVGRIRQTAHRIRLLCVARYMTHKNLEVLLGVADRLLAAGRRDVGLFITVEPGHGPGARALLAALAEGGRDQVLHNLGEVPMAEVAACYGAVDALILPTLLESFSSTYVDAMRAGVPVLTSDLDFARTVCGAAAGYFDPESPGSIVEALTTLEQDPEGWRRRTVEGRRRVETLFDDWDAIAPRVLDLLERVVGGRDLPDLFNDPWFRDSLGTRTENAH